MALAKLFRENPRCPKGTRRVKGVCTSRPGRTRREYAPVGKMMKARKACTYGETTTPRKVWPGFYCKRRPSRTGKARKPRSKTGKARKPRVKKNSSRHSLPPDFDDFSWSSLDNVRHNTTPVQIASYHSPSVHPSFYSSRRTPSLSSLSRHTPSVYLSPRTPSLHSSHHSPPRAPTPKTKKTRKPRDNGIDISNIITGSRRR